jgi:EAL domain-containing protein (putative c-di-GMP-specific phosphodiesterase class I)/ActR/RegA family two-component response regulator
MTSAIVLDDESDIRSLIGGLASQCGFKVEIASTPAEFIAQAMAKHPELIILDLVFPGGDGIEMLRFLEANTYKGALILVSGMDERVLTTACRLGSALGLNVIGSVQKPFKIAVLRDLLVTARGATAEHSHEQFLQAIADNQLALHYQPVVEIKTKQVLGVEALVRWAHPKRGLIMPDSFLPDLARIGLMRDLTWWVVNAAIQDSASWRDAGIDVRIALNVPSSVLCDPSFFSTLLDVKNRESRPGTRLMIELTETEAMDEPVRMMEVLSHLRLAGIELAIDDFGTGYSSLVELRRLPVNHLKIDKSFVLASVAETDASAITRAVINLSHALGIKVVAEGVETREIWDQLVEWGCEAAQGYLVSRPMPATDLPAWIAGFQACSAEESKS